MSSRGWKEVMKRLSFSATNPIFKFSAGNCKRIRTVLKDIGFSLA